MTIIASEGPGITERRAYNMKPPLLLRGSHCSIVKLFFTMFTIHCNIIAFLPLRRSLWALHPIVMAFEAEDSNEQDYLNPWTIITPAINKIIHFINKIKCLWVQFELFNLWVQNLARDELNGQHCQTSERSISKTSTLNSIKLSAAMMMFRQLSSRNGHWARNEVGSHVLWEAPSVDLWLIVW